MEEWLAFTETFSLFLLHDLPWKRQDLELKKAFDEQWTLLRSSVLYFMKWHDGQHTEERILQAQKDLLEYGRIVEKVRPLQFYMYTLVQTSSRWCCIRVLQTCSACVTAVFTALCQHVRLCRPTVADS